MKQGSTLFLKAVLVLLSLAVLAFLILMPPNEGRNVGADLFTIYFKDPFLAYVYVSSIPFFVGVYQAFKLLGYIEKNKAFSLAAVKALRNIKYCSIALMGLIAGAASWVKLTAVDDDPAGFLALSMIMAFATIVIATAAAVFEKLFQNAVDIKSENDLTV